MPFTVLKVPKLEGNLTEVLGEFPNIDAAEKFADCARTDDASEDFNYEVEAPNTEPPPDPW